MLFKALKHITCLGIDYAPGDIVPGAASFTNLKEMIDWRFIGYATEEEIAAYESKIAQQKEEAEKALIEQQAAEEATKKAEEEVANQVAKETAKAATKQEKSAK